LSEIVDRIKEALSRKPAREQLERAKYGLKAQIAKLELIQRNLEERDKTLFNRITEAYEKQDHLSMKALSSELAELRKAEKATLYSKLALERTLLRLEAAKSLDELARALVPTIGVMKNLRTAIGGLIPEAEDALRDVFETFNSALIGLGINLDSFRIYQPHSEEVEKILQEAEAIAEQKLKEKLPKTMGDLI